MSEYFGQILELYHEYTICVCFMGEGEDSKSRKRELLAYVRESHNRGYRCCLYSGRDVEIMRILHINFEKRIKYSILMNYGRRWLYGGCLHEGRQ